MENLNVSIANPDSTEAHELFAHFVPPTIDGSILKVFEEEFYPVAPLLLTTRQIQFTCPPCADFTDLSNTQIEIDVKIVRANGQPIPAAVAPEGANPNPSGGFDNNPIGSIFSDVDIKVSGVSLSPMNATYGYLHYLQTVLFFQKDARSSKLERQGYYDEVMSVCSFLRSSLGSFVRLTVYFFVGRRQYERCIRSNDWIWSKVSIYQRVPSLSAFWRSSSWPISTGLFVYPFVRLFVCLFVSFFIYQRLSFSLYL